MSSIIKVENLSKSYIISHEGQERYTALRDVMASKAKKIFSIPRSLGGSTKKESATKEEFWALKDVSFEIERGDRVGIIGRNGAGKSTLLKIISRITEPTKGRIEIRGRVASLLEVGTGFHPELTGRENIYLNGAILGMSRAEIKKKFDEIVDFADVEKFLDTPVKRYSSGMYVRLAFAVAAHLEPEILVVDEVLAVGDAQFQKKCLGKMEAVSKNEGRTILFVSHNMGVISQLCEKGILFQRGIMQFMGNVPETINNYIQTNSYSRSSYIANEITKTKDLFILKVEVLNEKMIPTETFCFEENIIIAIEVKVINFNPLVRLSITLQNFLGDFLSTFIENLEDYNSNNGIIKIKIKLPASVIVPNSYAFRVALFIPHSVVYDLIEMVCPFRIIESGSEMALFEGYNYGIFKLQHQVIE